MIIRTKTLNEPPVAQRSFLLLLALIGGTVALYWPSAVALWRYWTYLPSLGGHGSLVVVLAIWMLVRAKDRINSLPPHPAVWMLVPLLLCSLAWLISWKAGVQSLHLLMLPALILLAVLAAFGGAVARAAAVPVAYLYFSMPAWNLLSTPLQGLTVRAVALLAPAMGLPATVSGSVITFPNGATFVVTLACSGIGFLVQGLAVAVLLGELEMAAPARRLVLLLSIALIALLTNWLRVLLLLEIGYSRGMDNMLIADYHLEFGYVLFVIVLVAYVWAATRGSPVARDLGELGIAPPMSARWLAGAYIATYVSIAAGPLSVLLLSRETAASQVPPQLHLPLGHEEWRGPFLATAADWHPRFIGPHIEQHFSYVDGNERRVEAVAIGYPWQTQGQELVNEDNSLLGGGELSPLDYTMVRGDDDAYQEVIVADKAGRRSVIWSVYDIGGRSFVIPLFSQLWYGLRSLYSPAYSALLAFRAACAPSCDEARTTLQSFVHGMGKDLIIATGAAGQTERSPSRGANMQQVVDPRTIRADAELGTFRLPNRTVSGVRS